MAVGYVARRVYRILADGKGEKYLSGIRTASAVMKAWEIMVSRMPHIINTGAKSIQGSRVLVENVLGRRAA